MNQANQNEINEQPNRLASALTKGQVKFWVLVSSGGLLFASLLVALLVFASYKGYLYGENGIFVRYGISIVLGLASAAFLIGALKATAAVQGKKTGFSVDLGGGAAIAALVVIGAIYSTGSTEFTQGLYLVDSLTGRSIKSQEFSLTAKLPNGPQTVKVGAEGFLEFRNLPKILLGKTVELSIPTEGYLLVDENKRIMFNGETQNLSLQRNDPAMLRFRKSVCYEFIRLIVPLRVMAGDSFGDFPELPFANFVRPDLITYLTSIPLLNDPGELLLKDLQEMFVFVADEPIYKTELLKSKGNYAERLAGAAMRFTECGYPL